MNAVQTLCNDGVLWITLSILHYVADWHWQIIQVYSTAVSNYTLLYDTITRPCVASMAHTTFDPAISRLLQCVAMLRVVLVIAFLSVCPLHAGIVSKRMNSVLAGRVAH